MAAVPERGQPRSARGQGCVPGGQRDASCPLSPPVGLTEPRCGRWGGVGGAGALELPPQPCSQRKPAASSAVTGTRVLLLLLLSAAALLLHPIIIRGGCEKRKTQSQHSRADSPPPVTAAPSPRSVGPAGPAALPWPWGGEAEPGRRGKEGAGAGHTQGISLLSPARRAAQGLGAAAAGAPRAPLRSRTLRGTAPGSGQLAGSSPPPPAPSPGVISALSAWRIPHPHARCPPPELPLGPAGIRDAPGDFPTQAGVYEREGDQAQRRERCFQG